jgi:hypothetical protein
MSADERRQRARQAILDAFAERPLKLIEGEVISGPKENNTNGVPVNAEVEAGDTGSF